jgi:sulfopyruvate decarboxylase subunit alpha
MTTVATPIPAASVVAALEEAEVTHVVTVPDTHQRSVLDLLAVRHRPPVLRAATEDDTLGICAGLWMAGARPVAVIQQLGLFASVNALRAFTHDQGVPLAILAGLYGRDVGLAPDEDPSSAVRLCLPLLATLGLRATVVEGPESTDRIAPALRAAFDEGLTGVVVIGAPTA